MAEFKLELLSPSGDKYTATSRREANDLLFGAGYREAGKAAKSKGAKSDTKSDATAGEKA